MSYEKQHQNCWREGKEGPKTLHEKNGWDFIMDLKSMRTIVKLISSFLLKLKKRQHLTVLQRRKRAERAGLLGNLLPVYLPTGRCPLSHLQQNPSLVQRQFSAVLEQGIVASFIARSQSNGFQCLVYVGN